jgi:cell division protein FtsB
VYSVNIVNFHLEKGKKLPAGKYASYIQLIDKDTKQVFSDKLNFVFFELPRFTKKEHELDNIVEKWMFVIKNLYKLNNKPDALRTRIFERLFRKAEIAKMTKEQREEYEHSLKKYRNMTSLIEEVADLKKDKAALKKENAAYQKEVAELRRQLNVFQVHSSTGTARSRSKR